MDNTKQLKSGLPIRTIHAKDKKGRTTVFEISTESVSDLLLNYLDDDAQLMESRAQFEQFDERIMYYLPEAIFLSSRRNIIDFINEYVDNNYLNG